MFRKAAMFGLALVVIGFSLGCPKPSDDPNSHNGYAIHANFTSLGTIDGVLLRYVDEGAVDATAVPVDEDTIAIYALTGTGTAGDGSVYNYVIFLPSEIRDKFYSAGAVQWNLSDPLWWYLGTYYDWPAAMVRDDWQSAIAMLKDSASRPKAEVADLVPSPFSISTANGGSLAMPSNESAFINASDGMKLVLQYRYTLQAATAMGASAFDPADQAGSTISGSLPSAVTGVVAFEFPLSGLAASGQVLTARLTDASGPTDYDVTFSFTGDPGALGKGNIDPSATVVSQPPPG